MGDLANTVTLNDGTKFSADGTFDTARTFTFGGAATIEATAGNTLGLNTVLSGILTKTGTGTVSLKGENPNTASATWVVNAGTLLLDKTADMAGTNHGGAILSPVTVNNGGTLKNAANEQIDDDVSVTLQDGSVWDLGGMNEKINFMVYNGGCGQCHGPDDGLALARHFRIRRRDAFTIPSRSAIPRGWSSPRTTTRGR